MLKLGSGEFSCLRILVVLAFLLFAVPAHAASIECGDAKKITRLLLTMGFIPVVELEVGGLPSIIYNNPVTSEYAILMLKDGLLCEVGNGVAFHIFKWREA